MRLGHLQVGSTIHAACARHTARLRTAALVKRLCINGMMKRLYGLTEAIGTPEAVAGPGFDMSEI